MTTARTVDRKRSAFHAAWKLMRDFAFVSWHMLRMLHRACPWHLYLLLGLVLTQAVLPYARWAWFGELIDRATVAQHLDSIVEPWLWFSLLTLLVFVVEVGAQSVTYHIDEHFIETFAPFLPRARQRYGMSSFQRGNAVHDSLEAAERGEYSARFLVTGQFFLIGRILMVLAGILALVQFSPFLGVLVTAAALVIIAVELYCAVRQSLTDRSFWSDRSERTNLSGQFTRKEDMKGLILFGIDDGVIRKITHLAQRISRALRHLNRRLFPAELLMAISLAAVFAGGTWLTARATVEGGSPGDLAFLVTTLLTVGLSMKGIVEQTAQQALGCDKLVDLFRFVYGAHPAPTPESSSAVADNGCPTLRVTDLTFGYEDGQTVLERVSALFPAGETTFLVGSNGSGKTTLLNVLSRLYHVPPRTVFFGAGDISTIDGLSLRTRLKHLAQDAHPLRLSPRELLALPEGLDAAAARTPEAEARMWQALDLACLADTVRGFRRGLDEERSIWRAAEVDLSGGQQKKLSIAQLFMAILSGTVSAVVLDEPFHGIEPRHARIIFDHFEQLGVTLILVTHHMEMVPASARVVFLYRNEQEAQPRVEVREGTHRELLRSSPEYVTHCSFDPLWLNALLGDLSSVEG